MPTDIEDRLADLEARSEITALLHRYSTSVDYGDEAGWVDCFTEDAIFHSEDEHTGVRLVAGRGRAELADFVARHSRAPELYHKHLVVDPLIEVRGDEASCQSYFLVLVAEPDGRPAIAGFGRYVDRLHHDADGRWRIAHRVAEIEGRNPEWKLRRQSSA
jgi:3-phenylpropionate/cinnamic acid dioxygenase small subunit